MVDKAPKKYCKNYLGRGEDHCDECKSAAAAGWLTTEYMEAKYGFPGDRVCGDNCKCKIRYKAKRTITLVDPFPDIKE